MINHDIIFDLDKQRIGFVPMHCSNDKPESNNFNIFNNYINNFNTFRCVYT